MMPLADLYFDRHMLILQDELKYVEQTYLIVEFCKKVSGLLYVACLTFWTGTTGSMNMTITRMSTLENDNSIAPSHSGSESGKAVQKRLRVSCARYRNQILTYSVFGVTESIFSVILSQWRTIYPFLHFCEATFFFRESGTILCVNVFGADESNSSFILSQCRTVYPLAWLHFRSFSVQCWNLVRLYVFGVAEFISPVFA